MKIYAIKVFLVAMAVAIPVNIFLDFLFPDSEGMVIELSLAFFMKVVIAAPIIETLIMIPIISIISKFTNNINYVSLISAIVWGIIHSLGYPLHGIGIFYSFYLMSMAYQYWDLHSRGHALLVVMTIHALFNGTGLVLFAIES